MSTVIDLWWRGDGEGAHGWCADLPGRRLAVQVGDDVPDSAATGGARLTALLDALDDLRRYVDLMDVDQIRIHWRGGL